MDLETFEDIVRILALAGYSARFLGLLALGLGGGWFAISAYKKPGLSWKVKIAVVMVFAALTAMVIRFQTPGALGAYALGAGAALLFWGLRGVDYEFVEDEDEEE